VSKANKAGRTPATASPGVPSGPTSRRLNVRALIILAVVVLVVVPGFFALKAIQGHAGQAGYVAQAKRAMDEGRPDMALSFVNEYLRRNPEDLEALELKGKVLEQTARGGAGVEEAIRVQGQILAIDPERLDARRRSVELNLRIGNYRAAETAAAEYLARGPKDAAAHRLMAQAFEGVAFRGDESYWARAVAEYEEARKLDPGDINAATRLAYLYREKSKDPARARAVMDRVLAANPKSVQARLARFRFDLSEAGGGRADAALAELDEAIKLAPGDAEARILAAELATQRADPATARRHLAAIDPAPKDDLRIKLVTGLIEFLEQKPDDAIQSWRSGLVQTGGTNAELTWRLARVMLGMGRVRDAEPLMARYRQLAGGSEPPYEYRFLVALAKLRTGSTKEGIAELEAIRDKVGREYAAQVLVALGGAYEVDRDEAKALEAYRRASNLPGSGAQPWTSMARVQLNDRPAEATATLERGLLALPEDPALLTMLAQVLWQQEMAKPKDRDWSEFLRVLARAEKAAPNSPDVAVVRADYLAKTGQLDAGLKLIQDANAKAPASAGLWLARANVLAQLGRSDEALGVLDAATKAAGENAQFRTTRARLLLDRGETTAALDVLRRGLDVVPRDQWPLMYKGLGEYHQLRADFAAARRAFDEWARLVPDSAEPRLALMNLAIASGDSASMEAQVEGMRAVGGSGSLFWKVARAEFLLQPKANAAGPDGRPMGEADRLREAEALIRDVKATAPRQPASLLLEARLAERRGKVDDAVAAYRAALDLRGGQIALRPLVSLLASKGRNDEINALLKKNSAFSGDLVRLASGMALQMGDAEQAQRLAERMLQGDPTSVDAANWKAKVQASLGKPEEAEATLRQMTLQRPEEPTAWIQLMMFQAVRGEMPAAKATFEEMKRKARTDRPELLWATCYYRVLGMQPLADESFAEALRKWPDEPKVLQAAADYFEATARPAQAEAALRRVRQVAPALDWARRRLALNLSARPNDRAAWSEAMAIVGEAPSQSDGPEDRLLRAVVLSRSGDPRERDEAIRVLEALSAELPNSAKLHDVLARSLKDVDRPKAREHAARAASADGATAEAILFHAVLELEARNLDAANAALARLVAMAPNSLPTIELEARIRHGEGKDADAADVLRKAFEARRKAPDALDVGAKIVKVMLQLGLAEAAEPVAKELGALGPKGQIAYAEFLGGRGRAREAGAALEAAAKAGAAVDAARSAIALAAEAPAGGGEWLDRTDGLLSLALKGQPASPELLQMQAYLRHMKGDFAGEIRAYEDIIAKNPNSVVVLNNMAWTLSENYGKPEEGLARADEAIKKGGWSPHVADTRGVILTRLGRADEAVKALEAAAGSLPTGPIYFHLARAYKKAGREADSEKARDLARKAGLRPEQLQPSERDEAASLVGAAGAPAPAPRP